MTVTRKQGGGLAALISLVVGLAGAGLLLVNWIAGGVVLLLALAIHHVGQSSVTVLTCPACGQDDRVLR